jgi:hypothetical protein
MERSMNRPINWRLAGCVLLGFLLAPLMTAWWGDMPSPAERIGVAALAGAIGASVGFGIYEMWTRLRQRGA